LLPLAEALQRLGSEAAWIVHGDGLDEITTAGVTEVAELKDGKIRSFRITPEEAGLPRVSSDALKGGDADHNAAALKAVLEGRAGPYRDIALLNAAAALIVAGKADDLKAGVALAAAAVDEGKARAVLDRLVAVSNEEVKE